MGINLRGFRVGLFFCLWLITCCNAYAATDNNPSRLHPLSILVPAYFSPDWDKADWIALTRSVAEVSIFAILNPDSGPGTVPLKAYRTVLPEYKLGGGHLLGYIPTGYGTRPITEILADVKKYAEWYSVDGIFLDEMANQASLSNLAYYQEIYARIKKRYPAFKVVGNPGMYPDAAYFQTRPSTDTLVTFEGSVSAYMKPTRIKRNSPKIPVASLIYSGSSWPQAEVALRLAVRRKATWLFLTDRQLTNPWDQLPLYWKQEVLCISRLNRGLSC